MAKTWPAPIFSTVAIADCVKSGSLPSYRTRQGPDASVKATPNLMCGDEPARISYRASADLMKCVCPRMIFAPVGMSTRTVFKSIPAPHVRISKDERLRMQPRAKRKRYSAQHQENAAINKE